MFYKRKEAFRYVFPEPIPATCEIYQYSNGAKEKVQSFEAFILDLSSNGLKAFSNTNIPLYDNSVFIFSFSLSGTVLQFPGHIIRKRSAGISFEYGVQGAGNSVLQEQIVSILKIYVREQLKKHVN